jgi:hypothetical protein
MNHFIPPIYDSRTAKQPSAGPNGLNADTALTIPFSLLRFVPVRLPGFDCALCYAEV